MSVHNLPGRDVCSLMGAFLAKEATTGRKIGFHSDFGVNAVHRLDKQTSGVMLLAVNRETFRHFADLFTSNKVVKYYQALLHGRLGDVDAQGRWSAWHWPMTQQAAGRSNIAGAGARVEALTEFRILRSISQYTLIECRLHTGRTHQIRRHAALSGHAVMGDRRYGTSRAHRHIDRQYGFTRLALHAVRLSLTLPGSSEPTSFSTHLPQAVVHLMEEMDRHGTQSRR